MKELLANLFGIIQQWLKYRNSPISQRIRARKQIEDDSIDLTNKKIEIKTAVYSHDKDKVNSFLAKCLALITLSATLTSYTTGCVIQKDVPVYVSSDRTVSPMTNETGVVGWFVPDTVFAELLTLKLQLQELEKQQKIENSIKE